MTKQEFLDLTTFGELVEVAYDYGYEDFIEYYYTDSELDEYINDRLDSYVMENSWYDVRDMLNDIPQGYDYYNIESINEIYGVIDDGDDFDDLRDRLLESMEENDEFDDEDEDMDGEYTPSNWVYAENFDSSEEDEDTSDDDEDLLGRLIAASQSGAQILTEG